MRLSELPDFGHPSFSGPVAVCGCFVYISSFEGLDCDPCYAHSLVQVVQLAQLCMEFLNYMRHACTGLGGREALGEETDVSMRF